jgi:hypothetical protein
MADITFIVMMTMLIMIKGLYLRCIHDFKMMSECNGSLHCVQILENVSC